MELIAGIMLDVFFFARFTYIKTQFYKTKGVANVMTGDIFLSLFMDTEGIIMFAV